MIYLILGVVFLASFLINYNIGVRFYEKGYNAGFEESSKIYENRELTSRVNKLESK